MPPEKRIFQHSFPFHRPSAPSPADEHAQKRSRFGKSWPEDPPVTFTAQAVVGTPALEVMADPGHATIIANDAELKISHTTRQPGLVVTGTIGSREPLRILEGMRQIIEASNIPTGSQVSCTFQLVVSDAFSVQHPIAPQVVGQSSVQSSAAPPAEPRSSYSEALQVPSAPVASYQARSAKQALDTLSFPAPQQAVNPGTFAVPQQAAVPHYQAGHMQHVQPGSGLRSETAPRQDLANSVNAGSRHTAGASDSARQPQPSMRDGERPAPTWEQPPTEPKLADGPEPAGIAAGQDPLPSDLDYYTLRGECGNCKRRGHSLADCVNTSAAGDVSGCPLCNHHDHPGYSCPRGSLSKEDFKRIYWDQRKGKPMLRHTTDVFQRFRNDLLTTRDAPLTIEHARRLMRHGGPYYNANASWRYRWPEPEIAEVIQQLSGGRLVCQSHYHKRGLGSGLNHGHPSGSGHGYPSY